MPFLLQSIPTGVSPFALANTAKVDLSSLKAKYATSGLGPVTIQWWSAFIEMLKADMKTRKESSPTWLLKELLELKKNAQRSSVEDALVPEQLSQMWGIETNTIPEVCTQLDTSVPPGI